MTLRYTTDPCVYCRRRDTYFRRPVGGWEKKKRVKKEKIQNRKNNIARWRRNHRCYLCTEAAAAVESRWGGRRRQTSGCTSRSSARRRRRQILRERPPRALTAETPWPATGRHTHTAVADRRDSFSPSTVPFGSQTFLLDLTRAASIASVRIFFPRPCVNFMCVRRFTRL